MRIDANYNEIRSTASRLSQQSTQYQSLLTSMMARLNALQSVWQGTDSQAFIAQLEVLRPKMLQLKSAVDAYAAMLQASASAYEQLQANRTASARLL